MPINLIDAELTEADLQDIMDAIQLIKARMPFLVDLSPEQRRNLNKLGPASLQFARDALTVARQNEEVIPRGFDIDEFDRDLKLTEDLDAILLKVGSLYEHIDDTRYRVGAETMRSARLVYRFVQAVPRGPARDEAARKLGTRFRAQGRRQNSSQNDEDA